MVCTYRLSYVDRVIRLFVAELLFIGSYFWLAGSLRVLATALGFILLFTAVRKCCPLYEILKIQRTDNTTPEPKKCIKFFILALYIVVALIGAYYSNFFTKKIFLDDYNHMNGAYKQTLFFSGQNNRDESIKNYDALVGAYADFYTKYRTYQPFAMRNDTNFVSDLTSVEEKVISLNDMVRNGDLHEVHVALETVRPVFQSILKRNGFSMLAVSLVDFHDSMEKIIDAADAEKPEEVLNVYPEVDQKLKEVELAADDEEIQTIRQKLEALRSGAEQSETSNLSEKAAELKSAFVKVYLKRG